MGHFKSILGGVWLQGLSKQSILLAAVCYNDISTQSLCIYYDATRKGEVERHA